MKNIKLYRLVALEEMTLPELDFSFYGTQSQYLYFKTKQDALAFGFCENKEREERGLRPLKFLITEIGGWFHEDEEEENEIS